MLDLQCGLQVDGLIDQGLVGKQARRACTVVARSQMGLQRGLEHLHNCQLAWANLAYLSSTVCS
jgi:hypothetical protein